MEKNVVQNNFDGDKTITSYDAEKVWISTYDGKKVFCKHTSDKEMETNISMQEKIFGRQILVGRKTFKIYVPTIYDWNKKTKVLSMEYCDGVNLEFLLRNKKTYYFGVEILNRLLEFFITQGIYWIDFAPRNILVKDNTIKIVDFEKGFEMYNTIKDYLRNHVYEEYGSFSFLEDRMFLPNEVFDLDLNELQEIYFIKEIGPKRIKAVAKLLGYKDYLTKKDYLQIIKTFIIAEQPKIMNGEFIFPRVQLEQILKDKNVNPMAFDNYALEVLKINESVGNSFVKRGGKSCII